MDSNSFTKTKNWSGRNEVIETSGGLHTLWTQNKRLHTPRTTVHKPIRQDRRIQTELVSTLAKNATKPNPFEIIPLQTTGRKNNWTTQETLARAAVTLETERIEGSKPWCLWWWWWHSDVVYFVFFVAVANILSFSPMTFTVHLNWRTTSSSLVWSLLSQRLIPLHIELCRSICLNCHSVKNYISRLTSQW